MQEHPPPSLPPLLPLFCSGCFPLHVSEHFHQYMRMRVTLFLTFFFFFIARWFNGQLFPRISCNTLTTDSDPGLQLLSGWNSLINSDLHERLGTCHIFSVRTTSNGKKSHNQTRSFRLFNVNKNTFALIFCGCLHPTTTTRAFFSDESKRP